MKKDLAKYLGSLLLFGTNGVVSSYIAMDSSSIVLSRVVLGLAFLATVSFIGRATSKDSSLPLKPALFLVLSGFSLGAGWLCLFEAFDRIGPGLAMLIYYSGSAIVMALSPLLFKEKLTPKKGASFVLVLVGACLINGGSVITGTDPVGILLACLGAVSYAGLIIIGNKAEGIEGAKRGALQLAGAFAAIAIILAAKGGFSFAPPKESLGWILLLGVVNTGVGCYFYFTTLPRLESQTVAVCGYLEPLSSVAFSAIFLGEILGPIQLAGGVLIIAGAVAFELSKRKSSENRKKPKRRRSIPHLEKAHLH